MDEDHQLELEYLVDDWNLLCLLATLSGKWGRLKHLYDIAIIALHGVDRLILCDHVSSNGRDHVYIADGAVNMLDQHWMELYTARASKPNILSLVSIQGDSNVCGECSSVINRLNVVTVHVRRWLHIWKCSRKYKTVDTARGVAIRYVFGEL